MKAPSAPLSSPVTTHYSQFMCSAFILWSTTAAAGFLYCQLIITTVHLWPCRHLSLTFWTFLSLFKTLTSLQGVHPAARSSLELGETFPLDFQINQPPLFFSSSCCCCQPISWAANRFLAKLSNSKACSASHDNPKRRQNGLLLISRPLSGWRARHGDCHEGRVNLQAPGGRGGFSSPNESSVAF